MKKNIKKYILPTQNLSKHHHLDEVVNLAFDLQMRSVRNVTIYLYQPIFLLLVQEMRNDFYKSIFEAYEQII